VIFSSLALIISYSSFNLTTVLFDLMSISAYSSFT